MKSSCSFSWWIFLTFFCFWSIFDFWSINNLYDIIRPNRVNLPSPHLQWRLFSLSLIQIFTARSEMRADLFYWDGLYKNRKLIKRYPTYNTNLPKKYPICIYYINMVSFDAFPALSESSTSSKSLSFIGSDSFCSSTSFCSNSLFEILFNDFDVTCICIKFYVDFEVLFCRLLRNE